MIADHPKSLFLLVLIMLASIVKAFGMEPGPDVRLDPPRSVDLSGNTLTFAIPGGFSRDMPADDLVTQVDIENDDFHGRSAGKTLIRRWWDIKRPGFFGKELGVVMMSIDAIPTPENQRKVIDDDAFNLKDRLSFIMMIAEYLHRKYYAINRDNESDEPDRAAYFYSSFSRIGGEIEVSFWDETFNEQIWMGYGAGGPHGQLSNHYVIPISDHVFIEVSFTYSPNQGIESPREFLNTARQLTAPIKSSLSIDYTPNNPYRALAEDDWRKESVRDVVRRHQKQLAPLFDPEGRSLPPEDMERLNEH